MSKFLQDNFISSSIVVVFVLILFSVCLSFYDKQVMQKALDTRNQVELVKYEADQILQNIREMDISGRGFALIPEDRFLYFTVDQAQAAKRTSFKRLDSLFQLQHYSDPVAMSSLKKEVEAYIDMYEEMVLLVKQNDMEGYKNLLSQDRGDQIWNVYSAFSTKLFEFEDTLNQEALSEYEAANFRNTLVQIILLLISLPTLGFALHTLRKETNNRKVLLQNLEENNRKFLFDPGDESSSQETQDILMNSIANLKKATEYVTQISEGNYQVAWEGLHEQNKTLNENNLAGRLLHMKEQMKKVKQEDEIRLWTTEGLAQMSDIIRKHQHNLNLLTEHALTFLVHYLKAQQGGIYVIREEEDQNPYLHLSACYAFNRKKFIEKRIEMGEGILGQTYLEKETTLLTEIPQGFTHITSGLGDATPACLVVVPLKYNEEVPALVELASFQIFEPYQVTFIERAGEFIASAVATAQNNEKTQQLLDEFKVQTEKMRAQEEELRQNMEELVATQEEMHRKEKEREKRAAGVQDPSVS